MIALLALLSVALAAIPTDLLPTTTAAPTTAAPTSPTSPQPPTSPTTTIAPPTTVAPATPRPCVCAHGRVCHEFADTVQKCFETVHFRVRASVPAVSIQRRIEQHLHIRRVDYNQTNLYFAYVATPAAGEGYNGYAVTYIEREAEKAQALLHALGLAVVDAQFAPFQPPDFADLIKQEWYLDQDDE